MTWPIRGLSGRPGFWQTGAMRILPTLFFAAFATAAAAAETPVSPEAFDAFSQGRTLVYSDGDRAYGIEQYLPGRQVLWAFIGEECRRGHWYPEGSEICFVYENNPVPQCWSYFNTADGLRARFRDDPADAPMISVRESPDPMPCTGPMLGV